MSNEGAWRQTKTCATLAPPDSCELGYYLRDHVPKGANISNNFRAPKR